MLCFRVLEASSASDQPVQMLIQIESLINSKHVYGCHTYWLCDLRCFHANIMQWHTKLM